MSELNQTEESKIESSRYLCFSLGEEEYAIPLLSVKEVIAVPDITPLPFSPPHFLGIMNLRGQIISVIDMRKKLNIQPSESAETSVIICDLDPISLGVVVDSVNSVLAPQRNEVSDPPSMTDNKMQNYIEAVYSREKQLILMIDIARALGAEDYKAIEKATKTAA